jgi:predicted ATPase
MQQARECRCTETRHENRRIALTGGPGAGKTAVLEVIAKTFCRHVVVLPESASIVFGGGFPRRSELVLRKAAQRAIFHVQEELERGYLESQTHAILLCDRGTPDCAAYWPDDPLDFYREVGVDRDAMLARYAAVIHLRTPSADNGYGHQNPLRIESAVEAAAIDERIADVWKDHPRRFVVESTPDFMTKVQSTLALIRAELPACCR